MHCLPTVPRALGAVAPGIAVLLSAVHPCGDTGFQVRIGGETLHAPYRVYTSAAELLTLASPRNGDSGLFAACVGTRHHDGRVREACLRRLLGHQRAWINPFVLALLGDYVSEIGELAASAIPLLDADTLGALVRENPAFVAITRERAISYWNCHSRQRYRSYRQYPPVAMLDAVAAAGGAAAKHAGITL